MWFTRMYNEHVWYSSWLKLGTGSLANRLLVSRAWNDNRVSCSMTMWANCLAWPFRWSGKEQLTSSNHRCALFNSTRWVKSFPMWFLGGIRSRRPKNCILFDSQALRVELQDLFEVAISFDRHNGDRIQSEWLLWASFGCFWFVM